MRSATIYRQESSVVAGFADGVASRNYDLELVLLVPLPGVCQVLSTLRITAKEGDDDLSRHSGSWNSSR